MKQLSTFAVLNIDGGDRISFTYDEIDSNTGELASTNNKGNFCVVNNELKGHVDAIRNYIRANKLSS